MQFSLSSDLQWQWQEQHYLRRESPLFLFSPHPSPFFLPKAQQESPFLHLLLKEAAETCIFRQQVQHKAKIRMAIFTAFFKDTFAMNK